ncbi:MAG: acetate--CoA ligase family protein [Betaproteobacteria bacterium]|nr:acetate--CoA ligase family protein [Betaproteobacteria bacterium]
MASPKTSFEPLFHPRGVAIVGASHDLRRIGGQPVKFLATYGYKGRVYPINPKHTEIAGLRCYPTVASIDGPCDVAIVAVNGAAAIEVVRECGRKGIRFAVVFSAGFRETGATGLEQEAKLLAAARENGVRIIGPNCQGYLNISERLYATFGVLGLEPELKAGPVSSVAQSGGFGFGIVTQCESAGVGFRNLVSSGNESDVTTPEILDAYVDDEGTRLLVGFIEGVRDGRALMRVADRSVRAGKPILMWKAGNSEAGKRASLSHTAALTGSYDAYRAAYRQSGVIEMRDIDEISDSARALLPGRLPRGDRVAALGSSAGSCILFADRAAELGLDVVTLAPETVAAIAKVIPAYGSPHNPVDVTADVFNDLGAFTQAIDLVLADPSVDQLAVVYAGLSGEIALACNRAVAEAMERHDKPVMLGWTARRHRAEAAYKLADEAQIPYFTSPVRLANAAGVLARFTRYQDRANRRASLFAESSADIDTRLPARSGALSEAESKALLARWGLPVTGDVLLPPGQDADLLAAGLRYPVVVKVASADIAHKTEAGGVILGVRNRAELDGAVAEVIHRSRAYAPSARIEGALVSEMVVDAVEMLAGVTQDPVFGPMITLGMGGIQAEVLRDVTYRVAPFDEQTAREMIDELRGAALLKGFRKRPAADVDALAAFLARLSQVAWTLRDRLSELDVNPLMVRPQGAGVVAADALVVLDDGAPK